MTQSLWQNRFGIAAAIGCITFIAMGLSLGLLLLSFALQERGVSGTMMGFIAAMGGVATIAASPVVPVLVRRLGTLPMLLIAIAVAAGSFLAFNWASPLWLWFVLRFVNGAGISVVLIVVEFWINSLAPPERRGIVMGSYAAAQSIGFAIGPALLAVMEPRGLLPFAVAAGLILLGGVPALLGSGDAPVVETKSRRSVLKFVLALPSATLAAFTFGAVEAGMNLLPIYGLDVGLTVPAAALLATAVALGNVVLQIPLGQLADTIGRRKVLLGVGAVALLCTGLMPLAAQSPATILPLLFFWGGAVASLYTVGVAHLTSRYSGAELVSGNAAFVLLYSIGRLVGPPVVGGGLDLWKPHGFAVAMGLFLGFYVLVVTLRSPAFKVADPPLSPDPPTPPPAAP